MSISQIRLQRQRNHIFLLNLISTEKNKARHFFIVFLLLSVLIFLPLVSEARISSKTGTLNPDGTPWPAQPIAQFTARFGNNLIGKPWELSHNWNNGPEQDAQQYAWSNGVNVPFNFIHNSVTRTTTLSLAGGTSTTWNFTSSFMTQDIWLLVRSDNANFTSQLDNLYLDGKPIGKSIVAQNNIRYMHIHRDQIAYSELNNFVLTGNINFSWTGSPGPPQIQAMFTMQEFHPPAQQISTGANIYMIFFIAILSIFAGLFILRINRRIRT